MNFTKEELLEMRYALFAEWEGRSSIEWIVNGINIKKLRDKITRIIREGDKNGNL